MVFLIVKLLIVHNSNILICGIEKLLYLKVKKVQFQIKDVFLNRNLRIILVIQIYQIMNNLMINLI